MHIDTPEFAHFSLMLNHSSASRNRLASTNGFSRRKYTGFATHTHMQRQNPQLTVSVCRAGSGPVCHTGTNMAGLISYRHFFPKNDHNAVSHGQHGSQRVHHYLNSSAIALSQGQDYQLRMHYKLFVGWALPRSAGELTTEGTQREVGKIREERQRRGRKRDKVPHWHFFIPTSSPCYTVKPLMLACS